MTKFTTFISAAALLALVVFGVSPSTTAQSTTSSGLNITPRKNLKVEPGKSVTDKLTVGNLNSKADLHVTFKLIDFTFMNETGTPKLNLAEDAPQTSWSLKPFLTLPKTLVIPAGQSRTVEYTVKIPAGQGAGSYYSAIQYGTGGPNGGNVNLSASGVSLVFVSVPGVVNEKMTLSRFGAYASNNDNVSGRYLTVATTKPKEMAFTVKNEGNVAESPAGSIQVKYMLGDTWNIENVNSNSSLALIGQNRIFRSCIEAEVKQINVAGSAAPARECKEPKMWPGRYSANLSVFYGQNGNSTHEIVGNASFWYLPWWFIGAVAAVILLVVYIVFRIRRRLKRAVNGGPRGGQVRYR